MGTTAHRNMGQVLRSYRFRATTLATLLAVGMLTIACAPKANKKSSTDSVVKECSLASGQEHTLQGHWAANPVKISFHSGDWSSDEVSAITTGSDTWNSFFSQSKGISIFSIAGTSALNQGAPNCASTSTIADGAVIYKRASSWTKSASAIAVTSTCFNTSTTVTGGGLPLIFNAIIEINYQNFFTASAGKYPDLQSIALHELGHLMGLDHSCGPLGKPNQSQPYMNCPDPTSDPDNEILNTVMYPQVFFDGSAGEEKRSLTSNDQGRANCLY